ncbi:MAG: hypothetical protein H0X25_10435 [Acidobacteriales bacterium]|nr:hypothetical protein [Terriglobales bacterium]
MRYCHNCRHITTGKDPYCNQCGSTYNVRLCPRMHANPRAAKACSQCGATDLSTPAPKTPLYAKPFVLLLGIGPGIFLLLALCVYVVYFGYRLLQNPNNLLPLMLVGFGLGLLLYMWMSLRQRHK